MEVTGEELEEIIARAARKAVREYVAAEEKKAKSSKYHNTFLLMKAYRDAVFHIDNAVSEAAQVDAGAEMTATYLRSIRKTRFKTLIMKAHIDTALAEIKRRHEAADRAVEYVAFELYFMQGATYEEIAEELNTGKIRRAVG